MGFIHNSGQLDRQKSKYKPKQYGVKMAYLIDKAKASGKVHCWLHGSSLVLTTFSGRGKHGNDCIYHQPKPC